MLVNQLFTLIMFILVGLLMAKYIFRNWYDAIIIFAGIILSVVLGFILNKLIQPIWKINNIKSKREI